jgi:hypothetical protein
MDGDKPSTRKEEDRLGFAAVAERLAHAILKLQAPEGFVFGIEGRWGSGKTTLINFTIDFLTRMERAPEVINFSPWLIGARDELLQSLFDELAIAAAKIDPVESQSGEPERKSLGRAWIDRAKNPHWKLRQKERFRTSIGPKLRAFGALAGGLGKFAKTASELGVPLASAAGSMLERADEATQSLLSKGSASERKRELVAALKQLSRYIVVFVDDLDRLEPREASEVLRLVRTVADFPNIIYVMSYDPAALADTLSKAIQVQDGAEFLEKIVQVSFRVPRPEAYDLRRWFQAELEALFHSELEEASRETSNVLQRLARVVDVEGERYLQTGRDVVRVLNALRLHGKPVINNVDIVDMVWLQLTKIGHPAFYSWIEQYLTELSAVAEHRNLSVLGPTRSQLTEQLLRFLKEQYDDVTLGMIHLKEVLPAIDFRAGSNDPKLFSLSGVDFEPYISGKRLGSPHHYRYYFAFSHPAGSLSEAAIDSFIDAAGRSATEAAALLLEMSRQKRPQGGTVAEVLIDRLRARVEAMSPEAVSGIIAALSETLDDPALAVVGDFGKCPVWLSAYQLLFMLMRKPTNERTNNLYALFRGKSLGWLTEILRDEIFSHGMVGKKKDESRWLLSDEEFKEMLNLMFDRYRAARPDELLKIPYFMNILYAWLQGGCQSAFKFDPRSASNFDPLDRRVRAVALAPSELVGVAETARARVGV